MQTRRVGRIAAAALVAVATTVSWAATEAQRKAFLAEELELAKKDELYLVLDPATGSLQLRIDGIVLNRFDVIEARYGRPRLENSAQAQWAGVAYELSTQLEEPDRPDIKIIPDDDTTTPGDYIIKEQERLDASIPTTYRLQFSPDLLVVVRGEPLAMDFASRRRRWWYTLQEGWEGFRLWMKNDRIANRVVLFMTPAESRRLFKVLQLKMKMLVEQK
jgi:hypothetical protein